LRISALVIVAVCIIVAVIIRFAGAIHTVQVASLCEY
jgi:hypothetical protein